jgi:gas vesicle protein
MDKITQSSGNIFVDLGFTPELAEKLLKEADELMLLRKHPDVGPLIDFRKLIKKKVDDSSEKIRKLKHDISVYGDRRDSDACEDAEEKLQHEQAKHEAYKEVSYMIKEYLNQQYGVE